MKYAVCNMVKLPPIVCVCVSSQQIIKQQHSVSIKMSSVYAVKFVCQETHTHPHTDARAHTQTHRDWACPAGGSSDQPRLLLSSAYALLTFYPLHHACRQTNTPLGLWANKKRSYQPPLAHCTINLTPLPPSSCASVEHTTTCCHLSRQHHHPQTHTHTHS